MSDFTIRNFDSNVKEDLDFFHAVHNSAIEIIPELKDVLKPETEEYQMFIAVITSIVFKVMDNLEVMERRFVIHPTDITCRWQNPNYYFADDNHILNVAERALRHYKNIPLFFSAYNITMSLSDPAIKALEDKVTVIFNKIYGPGINETSFFKDI